MRDVLENEHLLEYLIQFTSFYTRCTVRTINKDWFTACLQFQYNDLRHPLIFNRTITQGILCHYTGLTREEAIMLPHKRKERSYGGFYREYHMRDTLSRIQMILGGWVGIERRLLYKKALVDAFNAHKRNTKAARQHRLDLIRKNKNMYVQKHMDDYLTRSHTGSM